MYTMTLYTSGKRGDPFPAPYKGSCQESNIYLIIVLCITGAFRMHIQDPEWTTHFYAYVPRSMSDMQKCDWGGKHNTNEW